MSVDIGPLVKRRGVYVPVTRGSLIEEERNAGDAAAASVLANKDAEASKSLFEEPAIAGLARTFEKLGVATKHRDELLDRVDHLEHILDSFMLKHFKAEFDTIYSDIDRWFDIITDHATSIDAFAEILNDGFMYSSVFYIPLDVCRFLPKFEGNPLSCIRLTIFSSDGRWLENGMDIRMYLDVDPDKRLVREVQYAPLIFEEHMTREEIQKNLTGPLLKFHDLREHIKTFLYSYFSKLVYE